MGTAPEVPVVDLSSVEADELTETFHTIGFAVVTGQGVSSDVVEDVFSMMELSFAPELPTGSCDA